METVNTSGRRKTAIARVYLTEGKGEMKINNRDYKEYFPTGTLQYIVNQPFGLTENVGKYDITANVDGGGISGHGLTTRDPRMVERKKPGQKKARKRFQFSKR
jgi:small subunit ribosomal protein S9